MERRQFLKLGLASSLMLTACAPKPSPAQPLWQALIGAVLSAYPQADIGATYQRLQRLLAVLPKREQQQLQQVLGLLDSRWFTGPLLGVWHGTAAAPAAALEAMKDHWLKLLNLAHNALVQLICLAAFADPVLQRQTGYPGPPYAKQLLGAGFDS
ncbi:hypothetical protein [Gallaecimonas sp. GXIMD1310]|uniref:hypothetical protein n=1 Tax=Gallaecimonas sp. GXIMD1310 TaxID=3131926 RepID=UPI00324E0C48